MLGFGHGRRGMQACGQAKLPRLSMLPDRTGRGSAAVGGDDIAPNLRDLADRRIPVAVCHHDGDQGSIALEALGRRTSGLQSEGLHRSGPPAILPSEGGRQRTRPGRDPVERGACRARAASAGRVTRIAGGRRMGEPQSSRTTRFSGGMPTSEGGKQRAQSGWRPGSGQRHRPGRASRAGQPERRGGESGARQQDTKPRKGAGSTPPSGREFAGAAGPTTDKWGERKATVSLVAAERLGRGGQWATVVLREEWLERACGTRAGCGSKPQKFRRLDGCRRRRELATATGAGHQIWAKGQRAGAVIGHDSPGHLGKYCSVRQKHSMRHRPTSGPAAATAGPCIEKQSAGRAFRPTSCGHGAVDFCVIFGINSVLFVPLSIKIVGYVVAMFCLNVPVISKWFFREKVR